MSPLPLYPRVSTVAIVPTTIITVSADNRSHWRNEELHALQRNIFRLPFITDVPENTDETRLFYRTNRRTLKNVSFLFKTVVTKIVFFEKSQWDFFGKPPTLCARRRIPFGHVCDDGAFETRRNSLWQTRVLYACAIDPRQIP